MPTALATLYCDEQDIRDILSEEGVDLRVDDDDDGAVNETEQLMITKALNQAAAKVNQYCVRFYTPAVLATSWTVHEWASNIAARELCKRRGNPVPTSIEKEYEDTIEDMKAVAAGEPIEDLVPRHQKGPRFSNGRVDTTYGVRKWRVQRPLSSPQAPERAQNVDYYAEWSYEI